MRFAVSKSPPVMVRPSSTELAPPPAGKTNHVQLSSWDRSYVGFQVTTLLLFDGSVSQPVEAVKKGLSRALVHYAPIAGRLADDGAEEEVLSVACTGEGVPFVAATADCAMADHGGLLDGAPFSAGLLDDLAVSYHPEARRTDPPMLMQVTEFACGGFAVGVTWNHTLADGDGMAQFLQDIGNLAREDKTATSVRPDHNKMRMALSIVLLISLLSAIAPLPSEALNVRGHLLKSKTFCSPPILLGPGSVSNKYYHDVDFPQGHIAIKSFDAEVVDENGVPIPLHETYLHHWVAEPYYALKNSHSADSQKLPKGVLRRNDGVCKTTLGQYFGLGSETRHTATWVPDPYGIESGNPESAPEGYEEKWLLNIHAIDTRGVADKPGCTECKCDFYNVTIDEYGRTISKNYTGGLFCCYDKTQCKVKEGFNGEVRKLFLQYKVTWLDWTDGVVPVKIYIFDVTDSALLNGTPEHSCKVEYQVEECSSVNRANDDCTHVKTSRAVLPRGGDIVFGVAHQHSGGSGSSLYGQDGRLLCESLPTYGTGQEAGNEANYIVGMSTCYPKPGSIKVSDGEVLTVVSNYSSDRQHTGVMGLFYILVAEPQQAAPAPSLCFSFPAKWCLPAWISSNM